LIVKDPLINACEAITAARVAITTYWLKPVRHNGKMDFHFSTNSCNVLLRVAKGKQLDRNNLRLRQILPN
jgi:hypothetical protein